MEKDTLISSCNMNQSETLACEENNTLLRSASVFSNLNKPSETFELKLTGNPPPTIGSPKDNLYQMSLGRKKTEDGGIGVFTAEKYFKGGSNEKTARITDNGRMKHHYRKDDKVDQQKVKPNIKPRNPSSSSEASPNSQNTSLSKTLKEYWSPSKQSHKAELKPRSPSLSSPASKDWFLSEQKKVNAKKFFNSFGCKCTCTDEKAVDIKEKVAENTNTSNKSSKTVDHGDVDGKEIRKASDETDQHPVSLVQTKQIEPESSTKEEISCQNYDDLGVGSQEDECSNLQVLNSEVGDVTVGKQLEEKTLKSLEVFGSPISDKNVLPKVMEIPKFPGSGRMFYDIESDSSSDLFEIKNLSDNFSTQSDNDEPKVAEIIENPKNVIRTSTITPTTTTTTTTTTAKTSISKAIQKHRDSMLLSCRSHKAVRVAGNTYRIDENAESDPQRHRKSEPVTPMSQYQTNQAKIRDLKTERLRHSLARKSFS